MKLSQDDLVPGSEDDGSVSGKLVMVQRFPESGGGVLITGRIDGLKAGKHGFHVHMKGELGNKCKDAGGHFNPYEVKAEAQNATTESNVQSQIRYGPYGTCGCCRSYSNGRPWFEEMRE